MEGYQSFMNLLYGFEPFRFQKKQRYLKARFGLEIYSFFLLCFSLKYLHNAVVVSYCYLILRFIKYCFNCQNYLELPMHST